MHIDSNSQSENIHLNQAQAASLFGVTPRTLREWEALNSDLRGERPNATTARYSLSQLAAFSRRMRQPLSIKGAKALGLPLHLFADFFTKKPANRFLADEGAGKGVNLLSTLQLTEHLRQLSEGEVDQLNPDVLRALRFGFRSASEEVTAIAALVASLVARSEGRN